MNYDQGTCLALGLIEQGSEGKYWLTHPQGFCRLSGVYTHNFGTRHK